MTVICITLYLCNLLLEYVMHLHELLLYFNGCDARAIGLCSGVDLVALLRRTCVMSRILKTLELLAASIALCLHSYI